MSCPAPRHARRGDGKVQSTYHHASLCQGTYSSRSYRPLVSNRAPRCRRQRRALSPESRARAILRGRREVLEMVKRLPKQPFTPSSKDVAKLEGLRLSDAHEASEKEMSATPDANIKISGGHSSPTTTRAMALNKNDQSELSFSYMAEPERPRSRSQSFQVGDPRLPEELKSSSKRSVARSRSSDIGVPQGYALGQESDWWWNWNELRCGSICAPNAAHPDAPCRHGITSSIESRKGHEVGVRTGCWFMNKPK